MKDLNHSVKGSLDPLPPLNNETYTEFSNSIDSLKSDIDMINLRIANLEYQLCIGDYINDKEEEDL